jgi:signal transduction histidine kinase
VTRLIDSLRGRLIILIIAALVLAQCLSFWLFVDERTMAVHAALGLETAGRAANVARLIEEAPPELHDSILRAANSPMVWFSLSDTPNVDHTNHSAGKVVVDSIRTQLPGSASRQIKVEIHEFGPFIMPADDIPPAMADRYKAMFRDHISAVEMQLSIALKAGGWLNVDTRFHSPPLQWQWASTLSFGLTAAVIITSTVWFLLLQLTGPLQRLAKAADRLGRGEEVKELSLIGPSEVRDLTEAFNQMRDRLTRYVTDRTRLLGALGHDLRSPLTGLRVRAELVEDDETRDHLVTTIEEMQEMVDSTLSFAKGVATREPSRDVLLGDFLGGICKEISEAGNRVDTAWSVNPRATVRPVLLKRALRNIIENACRYGESAHIALDLSGDNAVISVRDRGPGIPADMLEKVFDPFVRLETSRSRETGGSGLGLSIARTIIQSHGGDIVLENAGQGGLIARILLPVSTEKVGGMRDEN